jgi:hypothetical protein
MATHLYRLWPSYAKQAPVLGTTFLRSGALNCIPITLQRRAIRGGCWQEAKFEERATVMSYRDCFDRPPDRTTVITVLRKTTKVCRELKTRWDRVGMTTRT